MAKMQKMEGQIEVNCCANKLFQMFTEKQEHIPNLCSHIISNVEAHHHDWISVGTTRSWNYVLEGKCQYMTERHDLVDEENKTIHSTIIEGDMMKNYKEMTAKFQAIPKGDNCCLVKWTLEYDKLNESAHSPHIAMNFLLNLSKDLAARLANS